MNRFAKTGIMTAFILTLCFNVGTFGKTRVDEESKTASSKVKAEAVVDEQPSNRAALVKTNEQKGKAGFGNAISSDYILTEPKLETDDANKSTVNLINQGGHHIRWQVLSAGGGFATSNNFGILSVVGQATAGAGSSNSFRLNSGFIQFFGAGEGDCCVGVTGNVDGEGGVDIADLTFLIDHLFINFPPLVCLEEGNVDGDGGIDIADLTYLIDHLFINFPELPACP